MTRLHLILAATMLSSVILATQAAAEEADPGTNATLVAVAPNDSTAIAAQTIAPPAPFAAASMVSEEGLAAVSGMAEIQQLIVAQNSSTVSGNSVNGQSVTGVINIDGQAFQNLNGLSVLTANTGNNVSINSSMNVNVTVQH